MSIEVKKVYASEYDKLVEDNIHLLETLKDVENYFDQQHHPGKRSKRLNNLIKKVIQNLKYKIK